MRKLKALLAAVLVFALLLSLGTVAFAAGGSVGDAGFGFDDTEPDDPKPGPGTSGGSGSKKYEVIVEETEDGGTESDHRYAESGEKVIITVNPDEGNTLDEFTIIRKDNKEPVEFKYLGDGKYQFYMPASDVLVISSYVLMDVPFKDVDRTDWFFDAVRYVYQHGLMDGLSESEFGPNVTLTRAMVVTILYRYEGSPVVQGTSPFTDVPEGTWYADPVIWAASNNIVNGTSSTTFSPNSPITREQFAAILFRYANYRAYYTSARADLSVYSDASQISDYAVDAMSWTVAEEIITGVTNTTLVPQGNTTRAQAAVILMRFAQKFGE